MKYQIIIISVLVLFLNSIVICQNKNTKPGDIGSFSKANIYFEQNATDGDVEAVFEIQGGEEGLTKLNVASPTGKTVIDFGAPEKSTLGIRQFKFESPEPKNIQSLKSAYPEGIYEFNAVSSKGEKLAGKCKLVHKLPSTTNFIQPKPKAKKVSTKNLKIMWAKVKDIVSYIIYIEEGDFDFTVTMPASKNELFVPDGILKSATEYTLGIGTVSKEGNISFIETSFTTGN